MSEVRFHIEADGTRIDYEGGRAFFERSIVPLIDALARRTGCCAAAPAREPPAGPTWRPASPQHFAQFAGQVGARASTVDQRIMAFAFYLWNFEKQDSCDRAQISAFFRTLHEEPPADLEGRLEGLARTKRFIEAAGPGAWRLSTKGVNYVKNRLLAPESARA